MKFMTIRIVPEAFSGVTISLARFNISAVEVEHSRSSLTVLQNLSVVLLEGLLVTHHHHIDTGEPFLSSHRCLL